jgi:integrase
VEQELLTVHQTKFRKSRLIPLHPTTATALREYGKARERTLGVKVEAFFVSDRGKPLVYRTVHDTFETLRRRLGWVARGGHVAPRIHDIRHTYVCRALLRSYRQHQPIDQVIDALSTYVGHAKVSDTYWYVTAIPELMAIAAHSASRWLPKEVHDEDIPPGRQLCEAAPGVLPRALDQSAQREPTNGGRVPR